MALEAETTNGTQLETRRFSPEEVKKIQELAERIEKVGETIMGSRFRSSPSPIRFNPLTREYTNRYFCNTSQLVY